MKRYTGVRVWIYRLLTVGPHPALAIGAENALAHRILPRWQSLVRFRTRKPTTHMYSSATFQWGGATPDDACTPTRLNHAEAILPVDMGTQDVAAPDTTDAFFQNPCRLPCAATHCDAVSVRHRHGVKRGPANARYPFCPCLAGSQQPRPSIDISDAFRALRSLLPDANRRPGPCC